MARNIEIKARLANREETESLVRMHADEGPIRIDQEDVFFRVPQGRLKLRRFSDGTGELIQYHRPDGKQARLSTYFRTPTADPDGLQNALERALGVLGVVKKVRQLYLVGQTRVHLDDVHELGHFLELEVVLTDQQSLEKGHSIAQHWSNAFHITEAALVSCAYIDMLLTGEFPA